MDSESEDHIQYDSVRFTSQAVAEVDRGRAVIRVPRGEIISLELAYGCGSERPIIMVLIGVSLLALGVFPAILLLEMLAHGGAFPFKFLAAVAFTIPGVWFLDLVFRKRWMVKVHTRRE